jgi:hypothetical protein
MELTFSEEQVKMFVNGRYELPLTELSFCIETAAAYFLGRGVCRMSFSRHFSGKDNLHVEVIAKTPSKPMAFSAPASLKLMVQDGYFPKTIKTSDFFHIPGQIKQVHDGQNRLIEFSNEGTVIFIRDLNPDMFLGLLCYGISDFVTGFFYHGAKLIEAQYSLGAVQYKMDKGFDDIWLKSYLCGATGTDYPVHGTAGLLPV